MWIDPRMGFRTWEAVARDALETTTYDDPPQDAFVLARACGLVLVPGGSGSLDGDVLRYPSHARTVRQHGVIAHELGHWLLHRANEEDSEIGASYVGGALMLPRRAFDKDLGATRWDLNKLRARHPNASAEMVARRITQLRDSVVTIIDGRKQRRIVSPWIEDQHFARLTDWERLAAEEASDVGETVYLDDLCYAVPVIDGRWRRVIVVCELGQLSLRL